MNRARKSRKTKWSTPIAILLLVVIGVGLFGIFLWDKRQQAKDAEIYTDEEPFNPDRVTLEYEGNTYKLRRSLDTYLLIGLDKYSDSLGEPGVLTNDQQSDFLFLMLVDKVNQSYSAIHLNRDAMTTIHRLGLSGKRIGSFTGQLALAHTFGSGGKDSCRNTAQAVSDYLLGVPVEHYVALTMDAIPVMNDLVGGVTVHVDDDFSAIDPTLVQGSDVHLMGQQALTFVRTRHYVGDNSNLSRMNRQREYINALYTQMGDKLRQDDGFAARMASKLMDYSVSDLTTTELSNLADRLKDYRFDGITDIAGEAVLGEKYIEFYTDEADLYAVVLRTFFERKD